MYGGNGGIIAGGGALAATGLGMPLGWYFTASVAMLTVGFVLTRIAVRRRQRRPETEAVD